MAAYSNEIDGTSLLLSRPSYHDDQKTYISLCSFRAHAMATIPSLESPDNNHSFATHCVSSAIKANDSLDFRALLAGIIYKSQMNIFFLQLLLTPSHPVAFVNSICHDTLIKCFRAFHVCHRSPHPSKVLEILCSAIADNQVADTSTAGHAVHESRH